MNSLRLRTWPDPVLAQKCIECTLSPQERQRIGDEMIQIMFRNHGYGLAAPQVGLNQRLFVMRDPTYPNKGQIIANPVIEYLTPDKCTEWEGCLSLTWQDKQPRVLVERPKGVKIWFDMPSEPDKRIDWYTDTLDARCIQHEIDHLDGIMIFDHIKAKLSRKLYLDKCMKYRSKV